MIEANDKLSSFTENEKRDLMLSLEELAQIEGLRNYSALGSANSKYTELRIMIDSKAEKNDIVRHDGSVALTNDWDVGDNFKIKINEIRARDSDGLKLCNDGGAGIFLDHGGNVGIGTAIPSAKLYVNGDVVISGNIGLFGGSPIGKRLKADYNNCASLSDVVQALVDIGIFDQV